GGRAGAGGAGRAAGGSGEWRGGRGEAGPGGAAASRRLIAEAGVERAARERGARVGEIAAGGENLARELAARPSNFVTPTYLAGVAEELGHAHGLSVTALDREAIEAEGMGGLLAVARGTPDEPRVSSRGGR